MSQARILVVDDDPRLLRVLKLQLEAEGYSVVTAGSAEDALVLLADIRPQFVLTDLFLGKGRMDGTELVTRIQESRPGLPVAVLTARSEVREAVRATHAGAVDFLTKPVSREALLGCIAPHVQATTASGENWGAQFASRSPAVRAMLDHARRSAPTEVPVLITGARGAGKEALARAMHRASRRRERDFIAVDCSALAPEALEAQLFGHARGMGLLRTADGGTVYLEEVDALTADLQSKLLRMLVEQAVRPAGDSNAVPVDVRVISASREDLELRARTGQFREDLFYRLGVVRLHLPSLDERREDIPGLVAHRLSELVAEGTPRRVFAPEAMETLVAAPWPGNLAQLFSVVEQVASLSPSRVISAARVRKALGDAPAELMSFDQARAEFTRNYLRQLLEVSDGNVSRAARLAERNRTDFYKLLMRYGVNPSAFKER